MESVVVKLVVTKTFKDIKEANKFISDYSDNEQRIESSESNLQNLEPNEYLN